MDEALKNKIEAVLFSIGKKINIEEIMRMIKDKDKGKVVACLIELKNKYNSDENNSLMILQDGDDWKLTIKDQYIDVAKEIGIETELTKTVMETLAVIAYKNPVLQSDVIKIRTNKAYDHLKELEEQGYIQRERYGRTRKIKLTQKFFDYFDLPPDSLKDKFQNVEQMEKVIEDKEKQIHEIKEQKQEMIEQQKMDDKEREKRNIFMETEKKSVDEVLQHDEHGMEIIKGEKLGDLEVIDEPDNEENKDGNEDGKEDPGEEQTNEEPNGEKLGGLDVYNEPDSYIEPGLNYEKKSKSEDDKKEIKPEYKDKETIDKNKIEALQKSEETKEEQEIAKIQEMKDKVNIGSSEEEVKTPDEAAAKEEIKETITTSSVDIDAEEEGYKIKDNTIEEKNIKEINENIVEEQKEEPVEEQKEEKGNIENNETVEPKEETDETAEEETKANTEDIVQKVEEQVEEKGKEVPKGPTEDGKLKEEDLFQMDGLPDDIKSKIEEKADEIMGQAKPKKKSLFKESEKKEDA